MCKKSVIFQSINQINAIHINSVYIQQIGGQLESDFTDMRYQIINKNQSEAKINKRAKEANSHHELEQGSRSWAAWGEAYSRASPTFTSVISAILALVLGICVKKN